MVIYENTKTIYDLVENAGKTHKDHVFIRFEDEDVVHEVTYAQFAMECHAIAAWIEDINKAVGHRVHVGLLGGSSHRYLCALLGVMSNGNVVVPLDVQLNANTLADNLERADVEVLIYDWEFHDLLEAAKERCPRIKEYVCIQTHKNVESFRKLREKYMGQHLYPRIDENELAMILYTSGTTGKGKGVMLSHQNLIDNVFCTTESRDISKEVYLNVLPMHHVFCLNGDVLLSLRYGYQLCLNKEMSKLASHIQLFQPTFIRMVPMMAKSLYNRYNILRLQNPDKTVEECKEEVFGKQLDRVICGGGYLPPELAKNYQDIGINIAQGYGMSECSPKISAPDWDRPDKVSTVGKIVDRCEVRIVDGEIRVKSPSVMMGYYKDDKETDKVLTTDGWLLTGDLGYVDEENFLHFTGRKKNLIVLSNGENVAPEQIENMFNDENLIEDILVYGADDAIVAEVYPNYKYAQTKQIEDIQAAVDEIIKKYNEELPSFKRIMRCKVRENPFEKTSSKKIIRSQYFEQKKKEDVAMHTLRKPETEMQNTIYEIVAVNIGHRSFGIDSNLYEQGLDSLGSIMLLNDLHSKLGLAITLGELSSHASVLELEAFCEETKNRAQIDYTPKDVYPLTNLQLYFAYVMRGNTTANLPFLFKLDDKVDLNCLKKAVEDLFEVHSELKCVIQMGEKAYMNFRDDDRKIEIPIVSMSDEEWEKTRPNLVVPFLYQEGDSLVHSAIYKTKSANYFFFDLAHIMGDGMSMNVIFEDINALYAGEKLEKEAYTFYEYVLDEKDRDARGLRAKNIEYYQKLLDGIRINKSILARTDYHDLQTGENAAIRKYLENISMRKIRAFCKKHGVSENAMFLTTFNYCISIFNGEKDTVSSSIHSGRTDSRWNRITGPLFITYPFRYQNVPHETVPDLLKRSAKQIMETMDCYVATLHPDEMFFQYQGDILNIDEIGGLPAQRQRIQLDSLPFHLQVFYDKKGYFYELRYWENRFDKAQLEVFMECYEAVLEAMLEEPSVRRLRKHLPDSVLPKHYTIEIETLHKIVGKNLLTTQDAAEKVKVYVLDDMCRKLPYGGWGTLYVMDCEPEEYSEFIGNPYGEGTLYKTDLMARILPDQTLDLLESGGRVIMSESLMGRNYLDLCTLEKSVLTHEAISEVKAYVTYGGENKFMPAVDVKSSRAITLDELCEYLADKVEKCLLPQQIVLL